VELSKKLLIWQIKEKVYNIFQKRGEKYVCWIFEQRWIL
jgi:hypothetical protein